MNCEDNIGSQNLQQRKGMSDFSWNSCGLNKCSSHTHTDKLSNGQSKNYMKQPDAVVMYQPNSSSHNDWIFDVGSYPLHHLLLCKSLIFEFQLALLIVKLCLEITFKFQQKRSSTKRKAN